MRELPCAVIALLAAVLAQQAPIDSHPLQTPTFRSGVTYVEVEASVTDRDGRSVDSLTREDFALFDGGTPQPITTFTRVDIPVESAGAWVAGSRPDAPLASESVSNTALSGRVFALVLDAQQTSFRDSRRVIDAATTFVQQYVGPQDLIAVVGSGGTVAQSFTTEKAFAVRAIDWFRGERAQSSTEAGIDDFALNLDLPKGMAAVALTPNATIAKADQCMNLLHTMGTITALSKYMGRIQHRRRTIVLFGSGIKVPPDCDERAAESTITEVNRASVTVYGVDVRGMSDAGTPLTIQDYGSDPDAPGAASGLRAETTAQQDTLRYLANETGGFATVNLNDLAPAFSRIVRENSTYYLLGFVPANDRRDGKFHDIEVKVSRPDVRVQSRKGYVAARRDDTLEAAGTKTSAALSAALADPFPVSDIPMRVSADAFRGEKEKTAVSLTIELDASQFAFKEASGVHTDGLEVALYSARRGKAVVDGHEMLQLSLGDNYAAVRERGLRIGQRIEMLPGHHRLLVGLREINGGRIGTLPVEFDVVDFSKLPSMSSIVVTSAEAARVQTTHADLTLKDVLPSPPTARRTFARDDSLAVFAEVYGTRAQLAGLTMSATIDREDGTRMADVEATPHERRTDAAVPYTGRASLRSLMTGRYALTVRAVRQDGTHIVRSLPFEVR